jgi:hypothetical protein
MARIAPPPHVVSARGPGAVIHAVIQAASMTMPAAARAS